MSTDVDIWSYGATVDTGRGIAGFEVEAADGSIGKVDDASFEAGRSYIVVDTGPWIFGRRVMLPAGTVDVVDPDARRVVVSVTKEQVQSAPDYDPAADDGNEYRRHVATHYAGTTPGRA